LTPEVTVESSPQLFVRGSVLRGRIVDKDSPIVYGYGDDELPVYFNQAPVLNAGGVGRGGGAAQGPNAGLGQIITPNASPLRLSSYDPDAGADDTPAADERPRSEDVAQVRQLAQGGRGGRGGAVPRTRIVMQFPSDAAQLLLSGTIANGQFLTNRAIVVDNKLGNGHLVMFANRPFWRWQTQGTYTLGFNAILNWNDLDAR